MHKPLLSTGVSEKGFWCNLLAGEWSQLETSGLCIVDANRK